MEVSSQNIQYNKIKIIDDNDDNPIKYTIINNEEHEEHEENEGHEQGQNISKYMLFLKNDKTNIIYILHITKNKLEGLTGKIDIHKPLWINNNITILPSIYNYKLVKYTNSCNIDITNLNKQPIDLLKPDIDPTDLESDSSISNNKLTLEIDIELLDIKLIDNKLAYMWAFDEVIHKKSNFNGTYTRHIKPNIIDILNVIKFNNSSKIKIKRQNIIDIINELIIFDTYDIDNLDVDLDKDNILFGCGWSTHYITIFINKIHDSYNIGIINAGAGCEFHGILNEKCNGIIKYYNISRHNIRNFLVDYYNWYIFEMRENKYNLGYYYLYFLIEKYLVIEIDRRVENIMTYKTPTQVIGNCALVNILYYILYLEYDDFIIQAQYQANAEEYEYDESNVPLIDNTIDSYMDNIYIDFNKWYNYVKIYLKKCLYIELQQNNINNKYINEILYIYDTVPNLNKYKLQQNNTNNIKHLLTINKPSNDNIIIGKLDGKKIYSKSNIDSITEESNINRTNYIGIFYDMIDNCISIMISNQEKINEFYYIKILLMIAYFIRNIRNKNRFNIDFIKNLNINITSLNISKEKHEYIYKSFIIYLLILLDYQNINKNIDGDISDKCDTLKEDISNIVLFNSEYNDIIMDYMSKISVICNNIPGVDEIKGIYRYTIYNEIKVNINKKPNIYNEVNNNNNRNNKELFTNILLNNKYDNLKQGNIYITLHDIIYKSETINRTIMDYKLANYKDTIESYINLPSDMLIELTYNKYYDILLNNDNYTDDNYLFMYIIFFYMFMISTDENSTDKYRQIHELYHISFITKYCVNISNDNILVYLITEYAIYHNININIGISAELIIDNTLIIHPNEKNIFIGTKYRYNKILYQFQDTHVSKGIIEDTINFYNLFIVEPFKQSIFIIENKNNTEYSCSKIIELSALLPIYLIKNYYFKESDHNIGYSKDTNLAGLYIVDDNIFLDVEYKKKVIINMDGINGTVKEFYNCLTYLDSIILIYETDINYYILLDTYKLEFIINKQTNNISTTLYDIKYKLYYCNNEDIINNFGIFNIIDEDNNNKILCIYNYLLIKHTVININTYYEYKNINTSDYIRDIYDKYKKNFYTIIDKYDSTYILKSENDVLGILLNCFYFNSPIILLKTICQIKNLINIYNIDDIFMSYISVHFRNIYAIPILILLIKNIDEIYDYSIYNEIYNKYNIPINIESKFSTNVNRFVSNVEIEMKKNNYDTRDISSDIEHIYELLRHSIYHTNLNRSTLRGGDFSDEDDDSDFEGDNGADDFLREVSRLSSTPTGYYIAEHNIHIYFECTSPRYNRHYLKFNIPEQIYEIQNIENDFYHLCKNNIPNFDDNLFEENIKIAKKLGGYLLDTNNRTNLHPIMEILMGKGKSSVITPYICLDLLNFFYQGNHINSEIFIIMPNTLIEQSIKTIMTNLYPLVPYINIYTTYSPDMPKKYNIYLLNDVQFKTIYLKYDIDSDNKFIIYDEIDMMANPLTSNLNIIDSRTEDELPIIELKELFINIYDVIFSNNARSIAFWKRIKRICDVYDNTIHKSIAEYTTDINELVKTVFEYKDNQDKNTFISKIIIPYVLTNKYNLNYGIPEDKYFIAIPYLAANTPSYGSHFSNIYLSLFLTFVCYKLKAKMPVKLRAIDKNYLLNYYIKNENIDEINKLFTFTINIAKIKENIEYYKLLVKDDYEIDNDMIFIILNKNKKYYTNGKNISFTDLLLYKNVNNFVAFTGTAYVYPPISFDNNNNFNSSEIITRSNITFKNVTYDNIEQVIYQLLHDNSIIKSFYISKNKNTIENIVDCLLQYNTTETTLPKYNVLIDIGAYFVHYKISDLKEKIKRNITYNYLVYFDNGMKIFDLKNNIYILSISKQNSKNTLFYFSNRHITGVDAKQYMDINLHGLITISHNTNLRDFSQGIFRMRNILDGQTTDIIIQKESYTKYKRCLNRTEIDIIDKIDTKDTKKENCNNVNTVRKFIYTILKENNNKYENNKIKAVCEQNVKALLKTNTRDYIQFLYLAFEDIIRIHEEFQKDIQKRKYLPDSIQMQLINTFKINNNLNIYNIFNSYYSDDIINSLIKLYIENINKSQGHVLVEEHEQVEEQEEEEEEEEEMLERLDIEHNKISTQITISNDNLDKKNSIIMICTDYTNIYIIYDKKNAIIFIFSITEFIKFITRQTIEHLRLSNLYIVTLNSDYYYTYNIDEKVHDRLEEKEPIELQEINFVKIIAKLYIGKYKKSIILSSNESIIKSSAEFEAFYKTFKRHYIHQYINISRIDRYMTKYLKYKNKYLKMKKYIYN
jgi:hypothetical protein